MLLNTRAFAFAAGLTAAALFVLCAVAVALAPGSTTAFAGFLIHADLSGIARTLTFASFLGGLCIWTVGTGIVFALVAWIYNRMLAGGAQTQA